jgi:integrase
MIYVSFNRSSLTLCDALCDCNAMQRYGTKMSGENHNAARFVAVRDSRKRKIRGLVRRGEKFYAQMRILGANSKSRPVRIPLEATSLADAQKELEKKRTENRKGEMHLPGHRPKFETLVADYLRSAQFLGKKLGTRENEIQALNRWIAHLGGIRVDWIKPARMSDFRDRRKAQGVSARTINLDLVAFNNAMAYAVEKGWLTVAPRLKKLKEREPAKRTLLMAGDIERLLKACVPKVTKNAQELRFYLRFLLLSGAREAEALRVRWQDVDLWNQQVTIGADGDSKNRKFRAVNFSGELKDLLHEMEAARAPDSSFLFPSPQRGERDIAARSLRESFKLVREKARLPHVGFHDFRHFFASMCVMRGIDFATVASWLGHSDGGVLVGKVYGHLSDAHKRRMADSLWILESSA